MENIKIMTLTYRELVKYRIPYSSMQVLENDIVKHKITLSVNPRQLQDIIDTLEKSR